MQFLRDLWSLIRGRSVIVSKEFVDEHAYRLTLLNTQTTTLAQWGERIAKYERRAAGQRKAAQARAERAKTTQQEPQQ